MKNHTKFITLVPFMLIAALLTACSPSGSDSNPSASAKKSPKPDAYAVAANTPIDKEVEVTANDQMKFSLESFDVAPGEVVRLTLKNVGTMPKMSMGHNLVILVESADEKAFAEAAMQAPTTEYIPTALASKIIAHTKLLGPGESDSIVFKAPTQKGRYQFLCSFPGHYQVGMKGYMTVQ